MRNMTKEDLEALTDMASNTRESIPGMLRHIFDICPDTFRVHAAKILADDKDGKPTRFRPAVNTNP